MKTFIRLDDLRFYAYHGVHPQERLVGATFLVNVRLTLTDCDLALCHDNIAGTVDYGAVYAIVKMQMQQPANLLEHLAYRTATSILQQFGKVSHVEIKITKENPPFGADLGSASIELQVARQAF